jgi:hypothetical protein
VARTTEKNPLGTASGIARLDVGLTIANDKGSAEVQFELPGSLDEETRARLTAETVVPRCVRAVIRSIKHDSLVT